MDVQNINDAEWKGDTTCGRFKLLYESPEGNCSLVYFEITRPTIPHLHHRMTEVYIIKKGQGEIRIADEFKLVEPGDRIIISREIIHQIIPIKGTLEMEVLADPRFDPRDVKGFPNYYSKRESSQLFRPVIVGDLGEGKPPPLPDVDTSMHDFDDS